LEAATATTTSPIKAKAGKKYYLLRLLSISYILLITTPIIH